MRRSREATAASRQAILDAAARSFRERGIDGIGVADIMDAAGMTHGGFYRHFESKEALAGAAVDQALGERLAIAQSDPRRYLAEYLSSGHVKHPGFGCAIAALGAEAGHAGKAVTSTFAARVPELVDALAGANGKPRRTARIEAWQALASMVGAVVLARAVADSGLQAEILDAVRDAAPVRAVNGGKPVRSS